MGVRSGGGSYEFLIMDYGEDQERLLNFLNTEKPCGWDGNHFHGVHSWDIYHDDDYDSDDACCYSPEKLTKDFPGCVLFGWREQSDDCSCYPEYWNEIVVNGHSYCVSDVLVDGWLIGPIFCKRQDLMIDFYTTYTKEFELNEEGLSEEENCEE